MQPKAVPDENDRETVLLISPKTRDDVCQNEEMAALLANLNTDVSVTIKIREDSMSQATYAGKGKLEEIKAILDEEEIDSVVVNDNITPAQKRELENLFRKEVRDRTEIILDIFARRAITKEAQVQVEMARLQYMLPRLTRMWTHLSRQQGGIGQRGIGETQLENDRRLVKKRISHLKDDLEKIRRDRETQRKKRFKNEVFNVALVGYTNSGKSSLFNAFNGKTVLAKDQLFATLDTITKRVVVDEKEFYLVDTVGFISNLPHFLVESFKATLEEVMLSDLLLHVIDVANPYVMSQITAVESVLAELKIDDKPRMEIYNKTDLMPEVPEWVTKRGYAVSVKTGEGMPELRKALARRITV